MTLPAVEDLKTDCVSSGAGLPIGIDAYEHVLAFVAAQSLPSTRVVSMIDRAPRDDRERYLLRCAIVACRVHERELSRLRARLAELRRKTA